MNYLLLIPIVLYGFLAWARSGKGGAVGRRIRNSDYWAWRDALNEAEERVAQLRACEPKHEVSQS